MTHTVSLSDEQYARLDAVARTANTTPDTVLADLLNWLPAVKLNLRLRSVLSSGMPSGTWLVASSMGSR